jgi:S-adenosyl methyltransferase
MPDPASEAATFDTARPNIARVYLREPASILSQPAVAAHFDWSQPVGLLLCGILHHILDEENPGALVAELSQALPSSSYVFIHHLLDSGNPAIADVQAALQAGLGRGQFRSRAEIGALFGGLDLVPPGLVLVSEWRPDPGAPDAREHPVLQLACAGVARKP